MLSEQLASYTSEEAGDGSGAAAARGSAALTATALKKKDGAGKKRSLKEQGMTEKR